MTILPSSVRFNDMTKVAIIYVQEDFNAIYNVR